MVVGGDSGPQSHEFKAKCQILDGSFSTFVCCKIVFMYLCYEKTKNEQKRPEMAHLHSKKDEVRLDIQKRSEHHKFISVVSLFNQMFDLH